MKLQRKTLDNDNAKALEKRPEWQVPLSELMKALDAEIHFFQRQTELLHQRRPGRFNSNLPINRPSQILSPNDWAKLNPVAQQRLQAAEQRMAQAKSRLGLIVADINDYNDKVSGEGFLTGLWHFRSRRAEADELIKRRARAIRHLNIAEKHLEAELVWIRRHGIYRPEQNEENTTGDHHIDPIYRDRQLAILQNFQRTELAMRQELRDQINDIDVNSTVQVNKRNLDEVIVDRHFKAQIHQLKKRRNSRR